MLASSSGSRPEAAAATWVEKLAGECAGVATADAAAAVEAPVPLLMGFLCRFWRGRAGREAEP